MDKDKIARSLIIQYLDSCVGADPEHAEEIGVSLECLKTVWGIEDPNVAIPGIKSLVDLIPDPAYDTERATQLKLEGNAALKAGDLDLALQKYTDAISVNPNDATFYCNRAAVFSKTRAHERAISDAEKALSLDPKYATAYSRLAFAYFSLNQTEKARDAYRRGIQACPDNQALKDNLASLGPEPAPAGGAADPLAGLRAAFGNNPIFAQIGEKLSSPEAVALMQEPGMAEIIAEIQANPTSLMTKMGDPRIQKLMGLIMGGPH